MAGVSDPPRFHRPRPAPVPIFQFLDVFSHFFEIARGIGTALAFAGRMLQELTFVDSVLLITVFDLYAVRGKFSCKNTPKFTARPELGRTNPFAAMVHKAPCKKLPISSISIYRFPMVHGSVRHERFHGNCFVAGIRA
jgi:hypothetical protein